jgi:hypothetical protein
VKGSSSGRASARTGGRLLDKAGEEVCQCLIVSFLVAGIGRGTFFLLGSAGFSVLQMDVLVNSEGRAGCCVET